MVVSEKSRNFAMKIKKMTSPPRGRLKGVGKYQKNKPAASMEEAAATHERNDGKAMDCRQHFQNRD